MTKTLPGVANRRDGWIARERRTRTPRGSEGGSGVTKDACSVPIEPLSDVYHPSDERGSFQLGGHDSTPASHSKIIKFILNLSHLLSPSPLIFLDFLPAPPAPPA